MKMKIKGWVSFLFGLFGLISLLLISNVDTRLLVRNISLGFVVGGFVEFVAFLIENRTRIILMIRTRFLAIKGEFIRFSMSYQYLIKVQDKYLLVKNSNPNWNWYQHVGGKYKRLEETRHILSEFGQRMMLKDETHMYVKQGDLACFHTAKNAIKFLNWFDSRKDRENLTGVEFYEELLGGKAKENDIVY
jgi:hypothetical protein